MYNQFERRERRTFKILLEKRQHRKVQVERIEPMRNLVEERVLLELCKRTHVHIGTGHLPFAHFLDPVVHAAFVHPVFPFRIAFFRIFRFVETELGIIQVLGVLHHLGNDFFTHLLVYLGGLAGDEQLHLDGIQILSETFLFVQQREAGDCLRIERYPLFVLGDSDDDTHQSALADE